MLRQLVGMLACGGSRLSSTQETNIKTITSDTIRGGTARPTVLDIIQRMMDKCLAEDEKQQEILFDDDACCVCRSRVATVRAYPCGHTISCRLCATMMLKASAKAQEEHFLCIICRSDVHRLRYIRSNPIAISCKPEAPFALKFLRRNEFDLSR